MTLLISFLVGLLVLLVATISERIILGNRGKKGQLTSHFDSLKGKDTKLKKKFFSFKLKRNSIKDSNKDVKNRMSKNKYYIYILPICISIFILSYISFKSITMALIMSLFGLVFPKIMINKAKKKKKEIISYQFRDALNSIMTSLKAGLSINSAITKCAEDLEKLHGSLKEKPMLEEFRKIRSDMGMGFSVDDALKNFRNRIEMEEVDDFVNTIIIVRQKGGNPVEIMDNVTVMINEKISIKRDIDILTAGKKMESRILTMMPIILIFALSIFSPEYMEPLYSTTLGKILIIFGLVLLIINYFIGKKIIDINV